MKRLQFFKTGLKNLKTVGALTPSSKSLCRAMAKPIDWENARVIIELGGGDGPITKELLRKMHPDAKLLTFEILPEMALVLRKIKDDRLTVIEDSAENLDVHLKKIGAEKVDGIVSAIPFSVLPEADVRRIILGCRKVLKKGAPFIQVHYSLVIKKLYESIFSSVRLRFVPVNMPPAFVLVCYYAG